MWSRFGIRALALVLLLGGAGGGVYLGQGRAADEQGLSAQLAVDAGQDEVDYLKQRHQEHTGATAHQREAQRNAAEKAAATARTEAERARKAADAANRKKREEQQQRKDGADAPPPPFTEPIPAACNVYSGNRKIGCALLLSSGFKIDQMSCLDKLWTKESGWNHRARNPSSGAYGIPQSYPGNKMKSAGADWQTNPATQIKWGLGYIKSRYGDPCGAWARSEETGSY